MAFEDEFLEYVRRVWRVLPEWFRTPDEWEDLSEWCQEHLGSYSGIGGLIIGMGDGGDLRVARFRNQTRSVVRVVEWVRHESILVAEKKRARRVQPIELSVGDKVRHNKLGTGTVVRRRDATKSVVQWADGSESVRLNRFLQVLSTSSDE